MNHGNKKITYGFQKLTCTNTNIQKEHDKPTKIYVFFGVFTKTTYDGFILFSILQTIVFCFFIYCVSFFFLPSSN
jgi:hypothetical protein